MDIKLHVSLGTCSRYLGILELVKCIDPLPAMGDREPSAIVILSLPEHGNWWKTIEGSQSYEFIIQEPREFTEVKATGKLPLLTREVEGVEGWVGWLT